MSKYDLIIILHRSNQSTEGQVERLKNKKQKQEGNQGAMFPTLELLLLVLDHGFD